MKNKLLEKINDNIDRAMKLVVPRYDNKTYVYPPESSYVIEIMDSKDVLPETKKKFMIGQKTLIKKIKHNGSMFWKCV